MNKIVATLLVIIPGNFISFTQMRPEKPLYAVQDTLDINAPVDTLEIKNKISDTTATIFFQSVDTLRYNQKMQNNYKNAFKLKNDTFWESMKEPWLGDFLKNIFF